ncbi:type 1 glutamine amidotransferase [Albidovulum sp.]|uniref:type 1 glutamine amidotransferase n=1 Tax=Albidovulum sp. TaxID=1872424 RepID=UPI001D59834C|nr:type 1 glutamine amidotransferase [Paracoccaceae bacterium]MCB2121699.1 type 1 glutamine amidotransferase [Paracoccaceae bacterium]MCB2132512.1 type 1 glutamine amidotransferase [Paracoccaceae bacterium]MCB2137758.1 type 1 glutamine amidotransferase [Paracoccaceae bacterium]MCB2142250.1 type 1 glutamine amidotransferase [Paracoccaceae bacterium]
MLIGILQTGQAPEVLRTEMGDYPDMFVRLLANRGLTFKSFHVEGMEFPKDVHECDGWLITGSRHGAYEDHPFIRPLEDFIRKAFAERVPVVGICFGHQIIAQALGGKVEKFRGGWAVGPQDYDFGTEKVNLNAWHQDQVVERPAAAEVVGSNAFCENAALLYGDRAFTVQAHPEYGNDFIDGLMRTRGKGLVPDALMEDARARFSDRNSSAAIADRIADFFKQTRN